MKRSSILNIPFCLGAFIFLAIMPNLVFAQWNLISDGSVQIIEAKKEAYYDFVIPNDNRVYKILFELKGGDGGWVEYNYMDRFGTERTKRVNGGEGAIVNASYSAGMIESQMPAGSILRFIIGNRGQNAKFNLLSQGGYGAGGGGGTAILLSQDNGQNWSILLVAGGGGGAGIDIEKLDTHYNPGLPGLSSDEAIENKNSRISTMPGGRRGSGGEANGNTGAGGGAYGPGKSTNHQLFNGDAGWREHTRYGEPLGGVGGFQDNQPSGGWGFGGGGSGAQGGGGGGGYSGGGAGTPGYGGGGGSSYINTYALIPYEYSSRQNDNTNNSKDGWVKYKITPLNK